MKDNATSEVARIVASTLASKGGSRNDYKIMMGHSIFKALMLEILPRDAVDKIYISLAMDKSGTYIVPYFLYGMEIRVLAHSPTNKNAIYIVKKSVKPEPVAFLPPFQVGDWQAPLANSSYGAYTDAVAKLTSSSNSTVPVPKPKKKRKKPPIKQRRLIKI